jgi:hypothetical protein
MAALLFWGIRIKRLIDRAPGHSDDGSCRRGRLPWKHIRHRPTSKLEGFLGIPFIVPGDLPLAT